MTRLIDSVRTDAAQQRTGLMSYRLTAYRELPRTGLPDIFDGWADYTRYVRVLEKAGAIRDASFLWWVMRPSTKYPTLELRVAGSCTRLSVRANLIDEADESTAPVTDRLATGTVTRTGAKSQRPG